MPKFIFELTDDLAALVEAYRVKRGHKATAVSVRELISTALEVAGSLGVFSRSETGALRPLTEGYVRKGGLNPPDSQVVVRPPPPTPMRANRVKADIHVGPAASAPGSRLKKDKKGGKS